MKKSEDMSSCFDTIHKRGRQTDGRTDMASDRAAKFVVFEEIHNKYATQNQ